MSSFSETVQLKSNEELLTMVYRFDEWNEEMLDAVREELSKRNILPDDIHDRKLQVIEEEDAQLSQAKEASFFGQVIGWITVFGFLGIYIGYNYSFSKTKSKYTKKIYFTYDEASRKNGKYLFYTSLSLSLITLIYKLSTI